MEKNSLAIKEEGMPVSLLLPCNSSRVSFAGSLISLCLQKRRGKDKLYQHPVDLNEAMRFTGCSTLHFVSLRSLILVQLVLKDVNVSDALLT